MCLVNRTDYYKSREGWGWKIYRITDRGVRSYFRDDFTLMDTWMTCEDKGPRHCRKCSREHGYYIHDKGSRIKSNAWHVLRHVMDMYKGSAFISHEKLRNILVVKTKFRRVIASGVEYPLDHAPDSQYAVKTVEALEIYLDSSRAYYTDGTRYKPGKISMSIGTSEDHESHWGIVPYPKPKETQP